MHLLKRGLFACLATLLALSLAACGGSRTPEEPETPSVPAETPVTLRLGALKGPTAMGLVYLGGTYTDAEGREAPLYDMTLAASPDELTPALMKGELDAACIPANLAAVLYNRTGGEIVTLGINTLGVLYLVENGNAVTSWQDLAGTTLAAAGKGATPEYALRYLLTENGLDPDEDLTIDWKSEHSECVAALASGAATIALLPQPFVTVAQNKIDTLRVALDLTAEWDALDNGSALLTGVVAARRDFVEAHPAAVATFLADYAASVEQVNGDAAAAAVKIGELGIVDAAVAEKALPYCNIVCITGAEMQEKLSGYLQVLFDADPASVGADGEGGALPGDDFYYNFGL